MQRFEALFKGVSTQLGPRTMEKVRRNAAFHLLFLLPKSSFGRGKLSFGENKLHAA